MAGDHLQIMAMARINPWILMPLIIAMTRIIKMRMAMVVLSMTMLLLMVMIMVMKILLVSENGWNGRPGRLYPELPKLPSLHCLFGKPLITTGLWYLVIRKVDIVSSLVWIGLDNAQQQLRPSKHGNFSSTREASKPQWLRLLTPAVEWWVPLSQIRHELSPSFSTETFTIQVDWGWDLPFFFPLLLLGRQMYRLGHVQQVDSYWLVVWNIFNCSLYWE